jgi:hypothetical protein
VVSAPGGLDAQLSEFQIEQLRVDERRSRLYRSGNELKVGAVVLGVLEEDPTECARVDAKNFGRLDERSKTPARPDIK